MVFVLHGENISRSRNFILALQERLNRPNKIELEISQTSPKQLSDRCNDVDLFGEPAFVLFDLSNVGRTNLKPYSEVIGGVPQNAALIMLTGKKLAKNSVLIKACEKAGGKVILSEGKPKSNIFNFVDSVFYENRKRAYSEYQKLLEDGEDVFGIFAMLLYGLRNVLYAKFDSPNLSKVPGFVRGKVESQSSSFSERELLGLIDYFYFLDKGVKTGEILPEALIPLAIERVFGKK